MAKSFWFKPYTLDAVESSTNNNMHKHLGIELLEIGPDFLRARMPVDHRTTQPMGLLHGGASCVLSESLGSYASFLSIDPAKQRMVGIEINANHVKSATEGYVTGVTRSVHRGRTIHVWNTEIRNDAGDLVCISRLTVAILDKK